MKTEKPKNQGERLSHDDPMVGRWFHSTQGRCDGCGEDIIRWQGQILGVVPGRRTRSGDGAHRGCAWLEVLFECRSYALTVRDIFQPAQPLRKRTLERRERHQRSHSRGRRNE
jgi:hypothetical protein